MNRFTSMGRSHDVRLRHSEYIVWSEPRHLAETRLVRWSKRSRESGEERSRPMPTSKNHGRSDTDASGTAARGRCGWTTFELRMDPDVAEGDPVAMVLQSDMAAPRAAIAPEILELAYADPPLPVRGPQLVIHHLHAVQPMLDMRAPHDQARLVP